MKKHLIAAAVAAAVAAPAMAQNVSLYGALDASVQLLGKANGSANRTAFVDSAIVSSVWGLKGTEDLGGGLRAIFDLQGDVQTNNGGLNQNGIFRRQANVGLGGGFGEVALGVKTNPIIATNAALMPVSGNSVSTVTAVALGYADFFTRNAVTYTSPSMSGLVVQAQYGFANNLADSSAGDMWAASLNYTMGPLALRAAYQDRSKGGAASSSNSNVAWGNPASAPAAAANTTPDKTSSLAGVSYKIGDVTLAGAYFRNELSGPAGTFAGGNPQVTGVIDGQQFGIGYQASAAWLLGASYTQSESSKLTNLQARYALSKRTTAYVQYGSANNDASGKVRFAPTGSNTGVAPAQVVTGYVGIAGKTQSAFGLGVIHSF
jgi:predicted porin